MKLSNGFEVTVSDAVLDNWDLLELLTEIDSGKTILMTKAFPMLIGEEQFNELKNFMRKDGKVSITEMVALFTEIMNNLNGKKS